MYCLASKQTDGVFWTLCPGLTTAVLCHSLRRLGALRFLPNILRLQGDNFDLLQHNEQIDDSVWVPMTVHDRSRCEEAFQAKVSKAGS